MVLGDCSPDVHTQHITIIAVAVVAAKVHVSCPVETCVCRWEVNAVQWVSDRILWVGVQATICYYYQVK